MYHCIVLHIISVYIDLALSKTIGTHRQINIYYMQPSTIDRLNPVADEQV